MAILQNNHKLKIMHSLPYFWQVIIQFLLRNTSVSAYLQNQNKKVRARFRFISICTEFQSCFCVTPLSLGAKYKSGGAANTFETGLLRAQNIYRKQLHSNENQTKVYVMYSLGSEVAICLIKERNVLSLPYVFPGGGGGGGTQQIFIRGGSSRRSNPLPFYIPFFTKKVPLSYTFC